MYMTTAGCADWSQVRSERGFSLIELLIVVVILGILAAIVYPNYRSSVEKGRRSDGYAALAADQATLERCYTQYFAYNNANCPTSFPNSQQGNYSIAVSNQSATTYTLTATAIGGQASDTACATIGIDQANQKYSNGQVSNTCWQ